MTWTTVLWIVLAAGSMALGGWIAHCAIQWRGEDEAVREEIKAGGNLLLPMVINSGGKGGVSGVNGGKGGDGQGIGGGTGGKGGDGQGTGDCGGCRQ